MSVALPESYAKRHVCLHQLGEQNNVKWTLLKKDGDLQEATTETNHWHHEQQRFVEVKGENAERGSQETRRLDPARPSAAAGPGVSYLFTTPQLSMAMVPVMAMSVDCWRTKGGKNAVMTVSVL